MATHANALSHLRRALGAIGIERAVADAVQFHTAKRTGMAILQEYVGLWELNKGQRNALLHHRATGKERSAGAYNPRLLVAPVKKARVTWEEWMSAETQKVNDRRVLGIWTNLKSDHALRRGTQDPCLGPHRHSEKAGQSV